MGYKNYLVLHIGQGDADELGKISVNTELFDRFKDRDWQIRIGGGWNGQYYLVPPEDEDETTSGVETLVELFEEIQHYMDHDGGNYIRYDWLKSLNHEDRVAVLDVVGKPILKYGGEQPGSHEIECRRLELLNPVS